MVHRTISTIIYVTVSSTYPHTWGWRVGDGWAERKLEKTPTPDKTAVGPIHRWRVETFLNDNNGTTRTNPSTIQNIMVLLFENVSSPHPLATELKCTNESLGNCLKVIT